MSGRPPVIDEVQPVLLCPASHAATGSLALAPAFARVNAADSLFQHTVNELALMFPHVPPAVACLREQVPLVQQQLASLQAPAVGADGAGARPGLQPAVVPATLWIEPDHRGSALRAAALALHERQQGRDPLLLFIPADLKISHLQAFRHAAHRAAALASGGDLVVFGARLGGPEAGAAASELAAHRGLLRMGSGHAQASLAGAGARETLEYFSPALGADTGGGTAWHRAVGAGDRLANCGVWIARASSVTWWFGCAQPALMMAAEQALAASVPHAEGALVLRQLGEKACADAPHESVEWALWDGHTEAFLLEAGFGPREWSQWRAVWRSQGRDAGGNVLMGPVSASDCEGCLVISEDLPLEVSDLKDVAVVAAAGRVLVQPLAEMPGVGLDSRDLRFLNTGMPPRFDPFMETQPPELDVSVPGAGG